MDIYFVRHGQTDGNVSKRHQVEKSELTAVGKEQAQTAAEQLATLKPTHLITSSHVRAIQTAQIIGEELDMIPLTSPLFTELHRPKNIYGHYHFGFKSLWYITRWYFGGAGADVLSKEGESYENLRHRITSAREYLEELPDDARVVIVSHAVFISLFIAHVCQPKRLSFWQAIKHWTRLHSLKNAEVRHLQATKVANGCGWNLVND
jgi:probable phosphoglycerate mutase